MDDNHDCNLKVNIGTKSLVFTFMYLNRISTKSDDLFLSNSGFKSIRV